MDWMDGFILQVSGKKLWKTYEPALVEYPRPDLIRKPSVSFLTQRSRQGTAEYIPADMSPEETKPPAAPADVPLHSGDMLYVPRGVVHEAATLSEEHWPVTNGEVMSDEIYQSVSMHLTFGLEVAKGYSVEVSESCNVSYTACRLTDM